MKIPLIPLETAIADLLDDFDIKIEDMDDVLFKKWSLDGVRHVTTLEQSVHKLAILTVTDFQADYPKDLQQLCEISYRLTPQDDCGTKRTQLTKFVQQTSEGCDIEISVKCPKCHKNSCTGCGQDAVLVDVDRVWEMANSHIYEPRTFVSPNGVRTFGRGEYPSTFTDEFLLLKPATGPWFQVEKHIPNCVNAQCKDCQHTYQLSPSTETIGVDFKEGEILLAYTAEAVDDSGLPLIPDHREVINAVVLWVASRYYRRMSFRNMDDRNIENRYLRLEQQADIAIGRARSLLQIPSNAEFNEFLANNRYFKINNGLESLYETGHGYVGKRGRVDKFRN